MTFFDWLILSLWKLTLVLMSLVICIGASIVTLILLVRDCIGK